ncbi:PqqD family protein [Hujiaoplasma nucleasis]|uniref:PqqD family protein n=1 Tax=Hujiaoplasma nucleasis TaxID=2725268 RepID=A0A7L6N0T2_9MOLU|nr:PqqD family protein [Hujiaoplasma nucleasis]QLY39860.1 PqqD family protein [Hujiaoplasma nucleasis]
MKIKSDYVIKSIGEDIVVVPVKDEAVRFNGIISLNKTGQFLFKTLQNYDLEEGDLLKIVLDTYDVDEARAKKDIHTFIKKCQKHGLFN